VIKDVVVNLGSREPQQFAADYAISVGATLGAHLVGLAFAYDPIIADGAMGGIPVEAIEMQREENARTAKAAAASFESAAKKAGVSAETRILEASVSGAASLFGAMARRFDLAVVGQAQRERGPSEELVVEAALFESGRPVVFVPYIQRQGLKLDRVLVCWDGSRTAARAIGDAMPFLERAKAVEVLTIAEENKQEEIAGGDMVAHLGRHGIPTSPKRTSMGEISIENVILSYAADSGADFLVMGGYGHSRWREFILGGATRGILASMTLPVLMSH
jgi:nucleotide-binding universal stress UspA family protein